MFAFSRLQTRFVLTIQCGALLFSLLAGGLAYRLAFQRALAQSRQTIERLCLTVNTTAAIAAYVDNRDVANDVAGGLLNNEIVHSARIEAAAKTIVSRSKPDPETADAAFTVTCPLYSPFDRRERVGSLVITPSQQAVTRNARTEAVTQVLILVGQIGLTSLLAMVLVSALFSRPIGLLASTMRRLTPGGPQRLPMPAGHHEDEIGMLVRSSNELLEATESAFSEERRLRAEMEAMERQYRRIFDTTSAGILMLDGAGRLINANPTLMKIVGRTVDDYHSFDGLAFLREVFADPEIALALVRQSMRRQQTMAHDLELLRPDGSRRWVHCLISAHGSAGKISLIEGVLYDITDRKRKESEVLHLAQHDVLTGLKNRRASEQFIAAALRRAQQSGGSIAVLLIDLDCFKPINDSFGHAAGDEVLVAVADHLRQVIRSSTDLAGRMGGDEFILVVCDGGGDVAGMARVAEDLLRIIGRPLTLSGGCTVNLGASIGIARYPADGASYDELIRAADRAMYAVKHSGKCGFAFAKNQ
jgi:diguanylate cyclase (GGDEF)-like protein/PAS domain S-box-containing protein